jgi:hypothetical protein
LEIKLFDSESREGVGGIDKSGLWWDFSETKDWLRRENSSVWNYFFLFSLNFMKVLWQGQGNLFNNLELSQNLWRNSIGNFESRDGRIGNESA